MKPTGNGEGQDKERKLQIQLEDDVAQGMYCNLVLLNHNETEFVFDFAYVQPQQPKATVKARIQLHPKQAKRLFRVLGQRLEQYEKRFGPLEVTSGDMPPKSSVH